MNKKIKSTVALLLMSGMALGAMPVYATDATTPPPTVSIESSNEIAPRDAVLIYSDRVTSNSGRVDATIKYGVDTRTNQIIAVNGVSDVANHDDQNYYSNIASPSVYKYAISLNGQTLEVRIQFYAKTADDSTVGIRYENFVIEL